MTIVGLEDNIKELIVVVEQMLKQLRDPKLGDEMKIMTIGILQMSFTPTLSSAMKMTRLALEVNKKDEDRK